MRRRWAAALVRGMTEVFGRRLTPDQIGLALFLGRMYSVSTTLRDSLNNAIFNATAYSEANVYLSLHQSDPGTTGASEVTGGSYARQAIPKVASSSGTYTSNADIDFTGMPDTTGDNISHVGVWDAVSGVNFLIGAALTTAKVTNSGDTFRIASGSLTAAWT